MLAKISNCQEFQK